VSLLGPIPIAHLNGTSRDELDREYESLLLPNGRTDGLAHRLPLLVFATLQRRLRRPGRKFREVQPQTRQQQGVTAADFGVNE